MASTTPRDHSTQAGTTPSAWMRLLSMTTFVGVLGFAAAEIVQLVQHGQAGFADASLVNALTWLVGVNAWITGCGHMFFPNPIADAIGWPQGNPFQWEVGLAGLLIGILGVMAAGQDRGFQLATVIAFSVFYLGAAAGHMREMVRERNFSPGNAGFIFRYDILAPAAVIWLFAIT
jgi:hypothetical protein